jgi:hypothetical protein
MARSTPSSVAFKSLLDKFAARKEEYTEDYLKSVNSEVRALYPNENTFLNQIQKLRAVVAQKFGKESPQYKQSIYNLGVGQTRSLERRKEYSTDVAARNTVREASLSTDYVIDQTRKLLNSSNVYDRVVAAILATGSRISEILRHDVEFTPVNHDTVHISNLSKTGTEVTRRLNGITSSELIDALKFIRERLGQNTMVENKRTNESADKIQKGLTAHKLRYIAGQVNRSLYGSDQPETTYLQRYYGHHNPASTLSYEGIALKDLQPKPRVQKLKKPKMVEADTWLTRAIRTYSNPKKRGPEAAAIRQKLIRELREDAKANGIELTTRMLTSLFGYGPASL